MSGGSQGARSLNRAVVGAVADLLAAGIQVLHIAGPTQVGDVDAAKPEPIAGQPPYVLVSYVDHMELAYAAADLMLCRAGAMTCAELTAVGLPGVYVPLPHGNGEQRFNAQPIVDVGWRTPGVGRRTAPSLDPRPGHPVADEPAQAAHHVGAGRRFGPP